MTATLLRAERARKVYGDKIAVNDVSITLTDGDTVGIVGESGSGKSTLGRMLLGLSRPSGGDVLYDERPLREVLAGRRSALQFRRDVQMIQQDTSASFDPCLTIRQSLRIPAQVLGGLDRARADECIEALAPEMGIAPELIDRMPTELSGGQRQRMAILRALVVRPRLVVCDEVISALDVSVQARILNLLKRYVRDHGMGLVFISHQLPATAFITDELLVMYHGDVVERGETDRLLTAPASDYARGLVEAYRNLAAP
ncbi:ABC transporter ATP-binding protein [Microbacterium sp. 18062]|uniref:ABC transporter ATP-binding protein n=1 Tax=Microbacterium sp. 18062 TaxID=2681410 RepID=UPI00135B606F|nr:ATP-binding cassette domain-containing protein [Microbacterium sp. 18062]